MNNLSDFEDDSDESSLKSKSKKKVICEYKKAIDSIGSRSKANLSLPLSGKKNLNNVFVSESDYNINNDEWLINDTTKTSSNKRKYIINSDDDDSNEKRIKKNFIYFDCNEDFVCTKNINKKKKNIPKSSEFTKENSPDYYLNNKYESEDFSGLGVSNDFNEFEKEKPKISNDPKNYETNFIKILSPRTNKFQQKITELLDEKKSMENQKIISYDELTTKEFQEKSKVQTWRIKANIDNNNFLIPVS